MTGTCCSNGCLSPRLDHCRRGDRNFMLTRHRNEAPMPRQLVIDGNRIHDIASFYDEINRVFMVDVDWPLAHSLDALDDMLYGGYGALDGNAPATLVWTNYENNRRDLGPDATRAFLLAKL